MSSREVRRSKKKTDQDKPMAERTTKSRRPWLYIFSLFILVIIVVTFLGGPIVSRLGGGSRNIVFGSYGKTEIKFVPGNYLAQQRDILYDQVRESASGENVQYQAYQVWRGAFERTVIHTAILQKAEQSGVYVSDNRIDEMLLRVGPYIENGQFSETRYRNTPNSERYRWRNLFREDIIHQQYLQDLYHTGIENPAEVDFIKSMSAERRKFRFVLFPYEVYPDEEIAEYGRNNPDLFRKINVSRITVRSSEDDAEAIRQQIVEGTATFEDQARNFSDDAFSEKGGEMGWRMYHSLQPSFAEQEELDELFALAEGEISPVYESGSGWVFYRIEDTAVSPDFADAETVQDVWAYMTRFERGMIEDRLLEMAADFRQQTAEAESFNEAASDMDLTVSETDFFPINYGNVFFMDSVSVAGEENAGVLQGAAYDETFFTSLFALEDQEISEPIVLDRKIAVFQLTGVETEASSDTDFLDSYYPYIRQQYQDQDFNEYVFSSEKLEDNFSEVFSELFGN